MNTGGNRIISSTSSLCNSHGDDVDVSCVSVMVFVYFSTMKCVREPLSILSLHLSLCYSLFQNRAAVTESIFDAGLNFLYRTTAQDPRTPGTVNFCR